MLFNIYINDDMLKLYIVCYCLPIKKNDFYEDMLVTPTNQKIKTDKIRLDHSS